MHKKGPKAQHLRGIYRQEAEYRGSLYFTLTSQLVDERSQIELEKQIHITAVGKKAFSCYTMLQKSHTLAALTFFFDAKALRSDQNEMFNVRHCAALKGYI